VRRATRVEVDGDVADAVERLELLGDGADAVAAGHAGDVDGGDGAHGDSSVWNGFGTVWVVGSVG